MAFDQHLLTYGTGVCVEYQLEETQQDRSARTHCHVDSDWTSLVPSALYVRALRGGEEGSYGPRLECKKRCEMLIHQYNVHDENPRVYVTLKLNTAKSEWYENRGCYGQHC